MRGEGRAVGGRRISITIAISGNQQAPQETIPDRTPHRRSNKPGAAAHGSSSRLQPFGCKVQGGQKTPTRLSASGSLLALVTLCECARQSGYRERQEPSKHPPPPCGVPGREAARCRNGGARGPPARGGQGGPAGRVKTELHPEGRGPGRSWSCGEGTLWAVRAEALCSQGAQERGVPRRERKPGAR